MELVSNTIGLLICQAFLPSLDLGLSHLKFYIANTYPVRYKENYFTSVEPLE